MGIKIKIKKKRLPFFVTILQRWDEECLRLSKCLKSRLNYSRDKHVVWSASVLDCRQYCSPLPSPTIMVDSYLPVEKQLTKWRYKIMLNNYKLRTHFYRKQKQPVATTSVVIETLPDKALSTMRKGVTSQSFRSYLWFQSGKIMRNFSSLGLPYS